MRKLPEGVVGGPSCVVPPGVFARLPGRQSTLAVYRSRQAAADTPSAAYLAAARCG